MRARLSHHTLGSVSMTSINTGVRIRLIQPAGVTKEFAEPPTPCAALERSVSYTTCVAGVFEIEDSNLGVPCTCDDCMVTGVGHEFDAEDICMMTGSNASIEGEIFSTIDRVVVPNVQICVIGA